MYEEIEPGEDEERVFSVECISDCFIAQRHEGDTEPIERDREADPFGRQDLSHDHPWNRSQRARVRQNEQHHQHSCRLSRALFGLTYHQCFRLQAHSNHYIDQTDDAGAHEQDDPSSKAYVRSIKALLRSTMIEKIMTAVTLATPTMRVAYTAVFGLSRSLNIEVEYSTTAV
jgi:hypothetical protein